MEARCISSPISIFSKRFMTVSSMLFLLFFENEKPTDRKKIEKEVIKGICSTWSFASILLPQPQCCHFFLELLHILKLLDDLRENLACGTIQGSIDIPLRQSSTWVIRIQLISISPCGIHNDHQPFIHGFLDKLFQRSDGIIRRMSNRRRRTSSGDNKFCCCFFFFVVVCSWCQVLSKTSKITSAIEDDQHEHQEP